MNAMTLYWIIFISIFLIVFAIDFYITDHRKGELSVSQALKWAGTWVAIALLFGVSLFFFFPQNDFSTVNTAHIMGTKFIAGYLIEYSLSVDNLFIFIMIFSLMGVSPKNQPRLLKLGILLSIVLRILFIIVGLELVQKVEWIIYVFGLILLWTAYKMAFTDSQKQVEPQNNFLYKLASKLFPIDPNVDHPHFFSKINGKTHITMFMLVFLVIGSTDVLFAVDSIPAIIGVIREGATNVLTNSEEQFLAISSNVFAVMGLISLFFALKGIMGMFRFLKQGVCIILLFIGVKMILGWWEPVSHFFHDHSWVSLAVIIGTLLFSIILSRIIPEKVAEEKLNEKN